MFHVTRARTQLNHKHCIFHQPGDRGWRLSAVPSTICGPHLVQRDEGDDEAGGSRRENKTNGNIKEVWGRAQMESEVRKLR